MQPIDNFLREIQDHPLFPEVYARLKQARPQIPPFADNNENEWKLKTGQQKGFDLCLALLKINLEK